MVQDPSTSREGKLELIGVQVSCRCLEGAFEAASRLSIEPRFLAQLAEQPETKNPPPSEPGGSKASRFTSVGR